jgi:hypothetical protein
VPGEERQKEEKTEMEPCISAFFPLFGTIKVYSQGCTAPYTLMNIIN